MSRLINADAMLANESKAYMAAQSKCDDMTKKINKIVHKRIQMLIMRTNTAYDTDKVVRQLDELKYGCPKPYRETYECPGDRFCDECKMMAAIEIVKKGGVKDD